MTTASFTPGKRSFTLHIPPPQVKPFTIGLPYPEGAWPLPAMENMPVVFKEEETPMRGMSDLPLLQPLDAVFQDARSGVDAFVEGDLGGTSRLFRNGHFPLTPVGPKDYPRHDETAPTSTFRHRSQSPHIPSFGNPQPELLGLIAARWQDPHHPDSEDESLAPFELDSSSSEHKQATLSRPFKKQASRRFSPYPFSQMDDTPERFDTQTSRKIICRSRKVSKIPGRYKVFRSKGSEPIAEPLFPNDADFPDYSIFAHEHGNAVQGWIWVDGKWTSVADGYARVAENVKLYLQLDMLSWVRGDAWDRHVRKRAKLEESQMET
ncbi:hypothetical protein ONZ45_g7567 [Pleurotus djamor]|nr:hypothetical protein ONZ45_g7567 [Pleurotus djamor]